MIDMTVIAITTTMTTGDNATTGSRTKAEGAQRVLRFLLATEKDLRLAKTGRWNPAGAAPKRDGAGRFFPVELP